MDNLGDRELIEKMEINELRKMEGMRLLDSSDDIALRTCLKCDTQFESNWSGNRICPDCAAQNSDMGPYAEFITSSNVTLEDYVHEVVSNNSQWVNHIPSDNRMFDSTQPLSHYKKAESQTFTVTNVKPSGLIISNSALLPAPCDIQSLPDDPLKIRAAMDRKNLQCFIVDKMLTIEQLNELDRAIENNHSWILLSPKVSINTEMFFSEVNSK